VSVVKDKFTTSIVTILYVEKPRAVEVKLKCKQADSPSTVSLYLLEPRTCEYILGVESPLVCDLLHMADDRTGLMPTVDRDVLAQAGTRKGPASEQPSSPEPPEPPPAEEEGFEEHLQRHLKLHAEATAKAKNVDEESKQVEERNCRQNARESF